MRFLARTRFDPLRPALAIADVLMLLLTPSAAAASPTSSIGTYSGKTSQGQYFTMFVAPTASCLGTNGPVRLCLYASGPNNVQLMVNTTCPGGSLGSSYGVELGPSFVPSNGVVNQRQSLSPGTFASHIALTTHRAANGYFIVQANGCTSGKVTFTAKRTGPIKY
jgi:hypothetical protein